MDVQTITQLISTVGFPIACCIYLFYSNEKLRNTIEENTKAIESLKSLITIHNLQEHNNLDINKEV